MHKIDYKKEYKDLYLPKRKPVLIDVPPINFIAVDGKGSPQSEAYQNAMQLLYSLTFTIKMSKMSGKQPEGYFEYVVPPLEGLWWMKEKWSLQKRDEWLWTSMIRQPEFVNEEVYNWAIEECKRKKPETDYSVARFFAFEEGLCVQMMHIGPYSEEPASMENMYRFIDENNLINETGTIRKHHEIYLSDPRKTSPDKLRTVLRIPVKKK